MMTDRMPIYRAVVKYVRDAEESDYEKLAITVSKMLSKSGGAPATPAKAQRIMISDEWAFGAARASSAPPTDVIEENLADYARRFFHAFDTYRNAWLREMGGVIRPKHWEIDGFVLRMRDIYEKAQLVDRIKQIMVQEVKREGANKDSLFDVVFKYLAENGKDEIPTN